MHLIPHQVAREVKRQVPAIVDPKWSERGDMGYFAASLNGFHRCITVELRSAIMGIYGRVLSEEEAVTYIVHQLERS